MQPEVGEAAGEVWRYLDRHGEASALKLRADLKISQSLLFLALGWLSREGKITLLREERGYRAVLRREGGF